MKRVLLGLAVLAAASSIPQAASAQAGVDLTLIHGIPGVTVDVTVDGTVVIDELVPGQLANISSFAGRTLSNVTITDNTTAEVLIGPATLEVPSSGSHSIVAHLDAAGEPVITTFDNDISKTASGKARLTLRHTAEAPPIDLIVGDQRPITGLANPGQEALELPDGDLTDAQIAPAGDVAIAEISTIDLAADTNTIVYVVGSATDDTLDFVVQTVDFAVTASTTTTVAGATTTTVAGATTTTIVPSAVNTGSPIDGTSNTLLIAVALGGLVLAGGALAARRRT